MEKTKTVRLETSHQTHAFYSRQSLHFAIHQLAGSPTRPYWGLDPWQGMCPDHTTLVTFLLCGMMPNQLSCSGQGGMWIFSKLGVAGYRLLFENQCSSSPPKKCRSHKNFKTKVSHSAFFLFFLFLLFFLHLYDGSLTWFF